MARTSDGAMLWSGRASAKGKFRLFLRFALMDWWAIVAGILAAAEERIDDSRYVQKLAYELHESERSAIGLLLLCLRHLPLP